MRILVLGGSFNPVHWGHLVLVEELLDEFRYDLGLLVPAGKPPHKELAADPGPEARAAMLELAVAGNPRLRVDRSELGRPGDSYTIDTIRGLPARHELEGKPGLVLGDDLVAGFPSWREPAAIAAEAELIVARRTGLPWSLPFPHRVASNRLIALSSSEVRALAASGGSLRYLVPEAVRDFILSRGLYGSR